MRVMTYVPQLSTMLMLLLRWKKNFLSLPGPVIRSDILDVETSDILKAAGLRGRARPDLLVGGPPCTPFSKSGFWLEWKRKGLDPTASLLQAYTRVLREAQPRKFILEKCVCVNL